MLVSYNSLFSVTTSQKIEMFIECYYNGKTYKYGQTFLAEDKCNKCSCMTKGSITCSQRKCSSPAAKGNTKRYFFKQNVLRIISWYFYQHLSEIDYDCGVINIVLIYLLNS